MAFLTKLRPTLTRPPQPFINGYFEKDKSVSRLCSFGLPSHRSKTVRLKLNDVVPTRELEFIERSYRIKDIDTIRNYLVTNTELIPVLNEAYSEITKYFPTAALRLQVDYDRDVPDEAGHSSLYICTALDADTALDKLDEFDDRWWLDFPPQIRKKLYIHLEFVNE